MTDIPREIVERITPTSNNPSLDVATRAIVRQALESLTPEDLDTLARRHGLVLARDVGRQIQRPRWDIEGRAAVNSWNKCREAMLKWREAEVGDDC